MAEEDIFNYINGVHISFFTSIDKHNIDEMMLCCRRQMELFQKKGQFPVPGNFRRVAILAKKVKNYELEVKICELYIRIMGMYYENMKLKGKTPGVDCLDEDKSPHYRDIVKRLPRARANLAKQRAEKIDAAQEIS